MFQKQTGNESSPDYNYVPKANRERNSKTTYQGAGSQRPPPNCKHKTGRALLSPSLLCAHATAPNHTTICEGMQVRRLRSPGCLPTSKTLDFVPNYACKAATLSCRENTIWPTRHTAA
eukprot:scaffold253609_cov16-Tisochrysis_lutea.AAC.2